MLEPDTLIVEIAEKALEFAIRCRVDKRPIDGTFWWGTCPVCHSAYCLIPCAETLSNRNQRCVSCKQYELGKVLSVVRYGKYLLKLEDLRKQGTILEEVYSKLSKEYKSRMQDARKEAGFFEVDLREQGQIKDEVGVLKYLLTVNKQAGGRVQLSSSNTCRNLGLSQDDFNLRLHHLSLKGHIGISRLPATQTFARKLVEEADDLDFQYMTRSLSEEEYAEKRQINSANTASLICEGISSTSSPRITPLEFSKLLSQIKECLTKMEAEEISPIVATECNNRISEIQPKLNAFKQFAWERINSKLQMRRQIHAELKEARVKRDVGEISDQEYAKKVFSLSPKKETLDQRILILALVSQIGIRPLDFQVPPELEEELSVLEARFLVEEIDESTYQLKRKEVEKAIVGARMLKFPERSDIEGWLQSLRRKMADTEVLKNRILTEQTYHLVTADVNEDLQRIESLRSELGEEEAST